MPGIMQAPFRMTLRNAEQFDENKPTMAGSGVRVSSAPAIQRLILVFSVLR